MIDKRRLLIVAILLLAIMLAACSPSDETSYAVALVVDGNQQTLVLNRQATVAEVLDRADITLEERDRVSPETFTRIEDGMVITIVRVVEEVVIERETLPFNETITRNDGLPFGETRLLQAGVNGEVEITYRVITENGAEVSRSELRRVVITPPQEQVVMVGSAGDLPSVTITGKLVYISGGNAWIMEQNSANKRPLTTDGGLDGRVFSLSEDGRRLLFSRQEVSQTAESDEENEDGTPEATPQNEETSDESAGLNELWTILDVSDQASQPLRLELENVLYAQWAPGAERSILYSTAEPRPSFPGWQANNDLWQARVSANGVVVRRERVLAPSSGGLYGWYGTTFSAQPEGDLVAWAQPDGLGTLFPVEPDDNGSSNGRDGPPDSFGRINLFEFAPANAYDFVWVPTLSWSPDGELIATTAHGQPLGEELPEDSPIYDLWIIAADGSFEVNVKPRAGMWSMPQFSPLRSTDNDQVLGWLAYLQAIEPLNSAVGRYHLVVTDRDGSNQIVLYPPDEQAGLLPQIVAWSPDASQIAFVDRGNLFIVDISSGHVQQLTGDGLSHNPRWSS